MDVFGLRDRMVDAYSRYVKSFLAIKDPGIREFVEEFLAAGRLWPEPLVQLNPAFEPGATIDQLVSEGVLHSECSRIFRRDKTEASLGAPLTRHGHQGPVGTADHLQWAATGFRATDMVTQCANRS